MNKSKENMLGQPMLRTTARMVAGELADHELGQVVLSDMAADDRDIHLQALQALAVVDQLRDDPELMRLADQPPPGVNNTFGWRAFSVAAALLLAVGVFLSYWPEWESSQSADIKRYVTRVGEQRELLLDDGSRVVMNTGSEVLVDYSTASRNLVLNRGEAYFEVAKDGTRPFSVAVGGSRVTALGTAFSVHMRPDVFALSVTEGVVSVHDGAKPASPDGLRLDVVEGQSGMLKTLGEWHVGAGVRAEFNQLAGTVQVSRPLDIEGSLRWRNGMLRFENAPLSEVIKELNRYSAKKILIEDASLMGLEVYAAFRVDRIDIALADLERTMPIKIVSYFDRTVIESEPVKK